MLECDQLSANAPAGVIALPESSTLSPPPSVLRVVAPEPFVTATPLLSCLPVTHERSTVVVTVTVALLPVVLTELYPCVGVVWSTPE